jgi:hypothetical protein
MLQNKQLPTINLFGSGKEYAMINALLADVAAGPFIVMGIGSILVIALLIVLLIASTVWLIKHLFKKKN